MEEKDNNEIKNTPSILEEEQSIIEQISNVQSQEDFKYFIDLFNLNQGKKNAVRISKLNKLLDAIEDQAITRVIKDPGKLSNSDLLDYLKVIQESIERSNKYVNEVDNRPMIQLNQQNNISINGNDSSGLSRESKEKVLDTIKAILQGINNTEDAIVIENEGDQNDNN